MNAEGLGAYRSWGFKIRGLGNCNRYRYQCTQDNMHLNVIARCCWLFTCTSIVQESGWMHVQVRAFWEHWACWVAQEGCGMHIRRKVATWNPCVEPSEKQRPIAKCDPTRHTDGSAASGRVVKPAWSRMRGAKEVAQANWTCVWEIKMYYPAP